MNFNLSIPFVTVTILNAKEKHQKFFSDLFFSTEVETKKLFSVYIKIVDQILVNKINFLENDCISDDQNFVVLDTKNNKAIINFHEFTNDSINIEIEDSFDLYYLFTFIIESLLIIWGTNHEILFLHASGVAKKGIVTVFPAWRNTGKTNTILDQCKSGYDFCGDDFCIIRNKKVYLYPKSLNIFSYNLRAFPSVYKYFHTKTVVRLKLTTFLKDQLYKLSQVVSGPVSKVLFRLSQLAEVSTNIKVNPSQLEIPVCESGDLAEIFLLQKSNFEKSIISKIDQKTAHEKIFQTIKYELKDFFEIYSKYLFLFPNKKSKNIDDFEKDYKNLLIKLPTELKIKKIKKGTQ